MTDIDLVTDDTSSFFYNRKKNYSKLCSKCAIVMACAYANPAVIWLKHFGKRLWKIPRSEIFNIVFPKIKTLSCVLPSFKLQKKKKK
jgi:hypothetical protein